MKIFDYTRLFPFAVSLGCLIFLLSYQKLWYREDRTGLDCLSKFSFGFDKQYTHTHFEYIYAACCVYLSCWLSFSFSFVRSFTGSLACSITHSHFNHSLASAGWLNVAHTLLLSMCVPHACIHKHRLRSTLVFGWISKRQQSAINF